MARRSRESVIQMRTAREAREEEQFRVAQEPEVDLTRTNNRREARSYLLFVRG